MDDEEERPVDDGGIPAESGEGDWAGTRLPHNIEAEQALLGGLILAPGSFDLVEGRIQEDDFFSPANARVFAAMLGLRRRAQPIDPVLLRDELQRAGHLDAVGGAAGLAVLTDVATTGAHVEHYAGVVRDRSALRRLIKACTDAINAASASQARAEEVLDRAEHGIFEVATRNFSGDVKTMGAILDATWDKIEAHVSDSAVITGLETRFTELDQYLTGLHEDELIIVAGRPSMGKSTFALNIVRNVVTAGQKPALLFTLEMSAENIVRNMLAAQARVEGQKMRSLHLTSEDRRKLGDATDVLIASPLWVDETPAISLAELRGKARRLKAREDIRIVVIDYLQLMAPSQAARNRSREQEVSEISRGLKALAKELHLPVIALSQLSRRPEGRQDNRPILSDLRESGAIEQDADVVLMLHRPEYYKKEDSPGQAEVIISKQRNGPTGVVNLAFIGNQLRFENLAAGPEYPS